ncbi:hypothetical protein KRM28CT15_67260 [Krasilnikovia sp. M28-CT-15]
MIAVTYNKIDLGLRRTISHFRPASHLLIDALPMEGVSVADYADRTWRGNWAVTKERSRAEDRLVAAILPLADFRGCGRGRRGHDDVRAQLIAPELTCGLSKRGPKSVSLSAGLSRTW